MQEITFESYHELSGKGKHSEKTCTNLFKINSKDCVRLPIRKGALVEM